MSVGSQSLPQLLRGNAFLRKNGPLSRKSPCNTSWKIQLTRKIQATGAYLIAHRETCWPLTSWSDEIADLRLLILSECCFKDSGAHLRMKTTYESKNLVGKWHYGVNHELPSL